jgi:hypothetical protein
VRGKGSPAFFEKKAPKKRLIPVGCGEVVANAPRNQKFFASFFQKRSASFLLS